MEFSDHLRRPERWARILGWATLAGVEFGMIGPFGSYPANPFTRIVYWTVLFWAGSLILWPSIVAGFVIGPRRGFPPIFSGATLALVACVPVAVVAATGCYIFWPVHASGVRIVEWYGLTLLVALPAAGALVWLEMRQPWQATLARDRSDPAMPPIGDDVAVPGAATSSPAPGHLLALALCLQMEDHHVRIHLHGSSSLHLATMGQLVAQMGDRPGMQVHRSWWVARDAVHGAQIDGRSVALVLSNGLRVPVARNRVAILRAENWLSDLTR